MNHKLISNELNHYFSIIRTELDSSMEKTKTNILNNILTSQIITFFLSPVI